MSGRFTLFVMVGGLAAGVNVGVRWVASLFMPFEAAIVVAFFAALAVAFSLNRALVFQGGGRASRQFGRFLAVNLVALAQVWLVSVGLARLVFPWLRFDWHPETVAHVVGVASPIFTSYLAHKHYSFASSPEELPTASPVVEGLGTTPGSGQAEAASPDVDARPARALRPTKPY